jgi:hypothetical protein
MRRGQSRLLWLLLFLVTTILASFVSAQPVDDTVHIYYGNPDGSPIVANPDKPLVVNCWIRTPPDVNVGGFIITLSTQDQYFLEGMTQFNKMLYPVNEWTILGGGFTYPWLGTPPSDSGWHSLKFFGVGWGAHSSIHFETPTKILNFVYMVRDSAGFIGDTVACLSFLPDSAGFYLTACDSLGTAIYPVKVHLSQVSFEVPSEICDYVYGNVNGIGVFDAADVMYAVRYFKQIGLPPPDSCYNEIINTYNNYLYVALDVTGDCEVRGADVTRLVATLKGLGILGGCTLFPPGR